MLLYLSFFFLGFQWRIQPDNFVMLYRAFSLTYQHSRVATNWNEIGQKKEHTRTNLKIVIFQRCGKVEEIIIMPMEEGNMHAMMHVLGLCETRRVDRREKQYTKVIS